MSEGESEQQDDPGDDHSEEILVCGATFHRYQIVRVIGAGGMGAVYEALHVDLQKRVALKVLRPELARSADSRARFLREGQAASRLRHAHVVDISDVGVHDGIPFMAMEYLEGEDLAALIRREGPLSPTRTADLMLPVLAAVATAHAEGIVHRDLKPENIFLARSRHGVVQPKLLDFGISKLAGAVDGMNLTASASLLGTPYYMSPEQVHDSRNVDARSDQFALGVILYECVTGKRPFQGEALFAVLQAVVNAPITSPRASRPDLPAGFDALVLRAMSRAPGARFSSVDELGCALLPFASSAIRDVWSPVFEAASAAVADTLVGGASPVARSAETALPVDTLGASSRVVGAPRPAPSRPWRIAAAVGGPVALVLLALGWTALRRDPGPPRSQLSAVPPVAVPPVAVPPVAVRPVVEPLTLVEPPAPPPPAPLNTTYRAVLTVSPSTAHIEVDGEPVGTGAYVRVFAVDGTVHALRVSAAGFEPFVTTFRDAPPPVSVELVPEAAGPGAPPIARRADPAPRHGHRHGARGAESTPVAATVRPAQPDHAIDTTPPAPVRTSPPATLVIPTGSNGAAIVR